MRIYMQFIHSTKYSQVKFPTSPMKISVLEKLSKKYLLRTFFHPKIIFAQYIWK